MSYGIRIVSKDGTEVILPKKHDIVGSTYAIGGTTEARLSVTYNYVDIFRRVFGERGIYILHGMAVREAQSVLDRAIAALGEAQPDDDYWKPTDGNAREALVGLHRLSELALAAFPDDEMRWVCE